VFMFVQTDDGLGISGCRVGRRVDLIAEDICCLCSSINLRLAVHVAPPEVAVGEIARR
jgi:hypothetical protein